MAIPCPSNQTYEAFLAGRLDDAEIAAVGEHLDTCENCCQRVERLSQQSGRTLRPEAVLGQGHRNESLPSALEGAMAALLDPSPGGEPEEGVGSVGADLTGHSFGDFEILEEIAQGGMGIVYRARQISLNRLVALKLLGPIRQAVGDRVARFRTETEAVATIEHPNIVPIYSVGEWEGQPYFSMKLIEGGSLSDRVESLSPENLVKSGVTNRTSLTQCHRRIAQVMVAVCRAIQYTHDRGILHRDLKPTNVLMDDQGEPHITDFGLAKILEKDSEITGSFAVMGTPSYMAPEQATGHAREITTSADIYGLGGILYELLTGRPPFKESTPLATMRRVIDSEPPAPRKLCALVDPDLETICLKALSKDPDRRYRSAMAMVEDLERWLRGEPVLARPIGWGEKIWRWSWRNPVSSSLLLLVCLLLTTIVIGSGFFTVRVSKLYAQSDELVTQFQLAEAEELLSGDDSLNGLALLGRVLERDGAHAMAASRLVSALIHRDWALPGRTVWNHGGAVETVELSPDGRRMVSLGRDGSVKLWRSEGLGGGEEPLDPCDGRVEVIAMGPQSQRLFAGNDRGELLVWELDTGRLVDTRPLHGLKVTALVVSPSGERVITGSKDRTLRLVDLREPERTSGPVRAPGPVRSLGLSLQGTRVFATTEPGRVGVWNFETGQLVEELVRTMGRLRGAAFDVRGERLVTYGEGPKAIIWDIAEGLPANVNVEHRAPVACAGFNPNGRTLVTLGDDGLIRVWDAVTGKELRSASSRKARLDQLAFGPLGRTFLVVASGGECQLWKGDGSERVTNSLRHPDRVTAARFTADGRQIVTGCRDGKIRVWNVGARPHWSSILRHWGPVNAAGFLPNSRAIYTGGQDGFFRVFDSETGLPRFFPKGFRRPIGFMVASRDGKRLLAGEGARGMISSARVVDALTGSRVVESYRLGGALLCGAFDATGERVAFGSESGEVTAWRVNDDWEPMVQYRHLAPVSSVAFTQSGQRVVSASKDGTVVVRRLGAGEEWEGEIEIGDRVEMAALAPNDRQFLTASSNHTGQFWDLRTGAAVGPPLQHDDVVNWAEYSNEGRLALTASSDGTVRIWDPVTFSAVGRVQDPTGPVLRAHFDPEARRVVVVGSDGGVRVWDWESGRPLTERFIHTRDVYDASFSPDGQRLLTNAADDAARMWQLPDPPLPVPDWFLLFLRDLVGVSVDSMGVREPGPVGEESTIRQDVSDLPRDGYYECLAHWLLGADWDVAPEVTGITTTMEAYLAEAVDVGQYTSIHEVLGYAPTDRGGLQRRIEKVLTDRELLWRRDARFYSRVAVANHPEDPEIWRLRALVMGALGQVESEWEAWDRWFDLTEAVETSETP